MMDGPSNSEFVLALVAVLVVAFLFLPAAVAAFYAAQDLLGWPMWGRNKSEQRGFEPVVRNRPPDEP